MKAVVKYAKGKGLVEMREVDQPVPKDDEVLIEVKSVSICGSDLHIYHDAHPYWPPMIMGHEFSGQIAEVGKGVEKWSAGDRVVSETRTGSCGACRYCEAGIPQVCPQKRPPGIGINGAYAKYVVMPARLLHRMPDELSFDEAACVEPTAVCYHGVIERMGIAPGEVAVVSGPGPIGLLSILLAKLAGASLVIASGTARSADLKLAKAKEIGADVLVNVGEQNLRGEVEKLTDGYGADVVIEASGAGQAVEDALHIVRRHGKICALGISGKTAVEIPWDVGVFKAAHLIFAFSSSWTSWESVLSLMGSRKLDVSSLITHRAPLEDWEKVFKEMEQGKVIKAILHP